MYIKRFVEETIQRTAGSFPCVVVYGPRQVGKSTTIDMLFGDKYRKVTLDDIDDRTLAHSNPRLFLETYRWPLMIDEIQKAPELLDEIKKTIDNQRLQWLKTGEQQQLMYILSGSNRFELQQGVSDSLAGRCGIVEMNSFSLAEKFEEKNHLFTTDINQLLDYEQNTNRKYKTKSEIFTEIFTGGMPDVCTRVSDREIYFNSYVNTYIEKDVRKLISATSEMQFRNFISILALRTSQELHYDEIASNVGIDVRTCKKWISILETSGIIYLLQPYLANISNRLIKTSKIYFMDTGLCAYLCKWPNPQMLENCAMGGAFFETFIVSEIIKNLQSNGVDPKSTVFYYRDIDKKEIDLIHVSQNSITPIEIKEGFAPKNPTKNFSVLSKYKMEIKPGLVISSCDKIRPINEASYFFPAYLI